VVRLRIEELAQILGKTKNEMENMLKNSDVIELNLSERSRKTREDESLRIFE